MKLPDAVAEKQSNKAPTWHRFAAISFTIALSAYGIAYASSLDLFTSIRGWQITLLTFCATPIVQASALFPEKTFWLSPAWMILSFLCRRPLFSVWSTGISAYQIFVYCLCKYYRQRCFHAFVIGNVVIALGFWGFIIGCSLNLSGMSITFHPIDRYMRSLHEFDDKYAEAIESENAPSFFFLLSNEIILHGLTQLQFAFVMMYHTDLVKTIDMFITMKDNLRFLAWWILVTNFFSPDEMPYKPIPPGFSRIVALVILASYYMSDNLPSKQKRV